MHSDRNKRLSFGTPIVVSQPGRMSVFVLVKFMNTNNKQNNQRHDFGNDLAQIIGVFTALGVVLLFGFKLYGFDYNDPINIKPFILILFVGIILSFVLGRSVRGDDIVMDRWSSEELAKATVTIFMIAGSIYVYYNIFFGERY